VNASGRAATSDAPGVTWAIVGGGIHGVHIAVRLLDRGVALENLRIVDPGPELLHSWFRCTSNTGMQFLRSPAVHNLDLNPWSIHRFADATGRGRKSAKGLFAAPYDRPSTALFEDHSRDVIARFGLADRHVRGAVTRLDVSCDGVDLALRGGSSLRAHRVVLALGAADRPRWPLWAEALRGQGGQVQHVFEPGFVFDPDEWPARVAVVGGGITAAQAALRLASGGRQVHLLARHRPRPHQFDSDPGWLGPKRMRDFVETQDPDVRRVMIDKARNAGSMPPDILRILKAAVSEGSIQRHEGQIACWGGPPVSLDVGEDQITLDAVLLATGFESARPGGALVDSLVESADLPCASCGYPILDRHLRWHPRVFVSGPLAELQVGPVSRNIAGARRAADRIVRAGAVA